MSLEVQASHIFGSFSLDVAFRAGEGVTALFGPSGAGKTTIVKAIAGLLAPDSGRISVRGKALYDSAQGVNLSVHQRRIGYVFQDGRLFPHMSVASNIRFGARFAKTDVDQHAVEQVIDLLGIAHLQAARPRNLSGGEQQRVALARALLSQPELLLMDEPLAALDQPRKEEIFPYLERLRDQSALPIVYVSHSLEEVARLADHLVVLKDGGVVCEGPADQVLSDPAALPIVGVREAGAILTGTVIEHDEDGLSRLAISSGELLLPHVNADPGDRLRIRVLAQDILLSLNAPHGLSSRNVIPVTVQSLHKGAGPGVAVGLRAGEDRLLARITQRAAEELNIRPGLECFAILKATAVPRGNIARGRVEA